MNKYLIIFVLLFFVSMPTLVKAEEVDSDNDGLNDSQERMIGTDPTMPILTMMDSKMAMR